MKECELCKVPARMYCESDQASLCWDCDARVHCANFLVARHLRNLLCQICQCPTPWKASGPKLGATVTICDRCVSRCDGHKSGAEDEDEGETDGRDDSSEEEGEDEEEDDDDDDDVNVNDEDGDNQVVPWSSTPPPATSSSSSSSSEESSSSRGRAPMALSLKRTRDNTDVCSQGDLYCSSSPAAAVGCLAEDEATSSSRPPKDRKKDQVLRPARAADSRSALISSIRRYQQEKALSSEEDVLDICKISKDHPTDVHPLSTSNHNRPL